MLVKHNRYFAEWHDVDGRRRRRSFARQKDATRYARRMRALTTIYRAARELNASIHWKQRSALENLVELVKAIDDHVQREEDTRAAMIDDRAEDRVRGRRAARAERP